MKLVQCEIIWLNNCWYSFKFFLFYQSIKLKNGFKNVVFSVLEFIYDRGRTEKHNEENKIIDIW